MQQLAMTWLGVKGRRPGASAEKQGLKNLTVCIMLFRMAPRYKRVAEFIRGPIKLINPPKKRLI